LTTKAPYKRYAMSRDNTIIPFRQPEAIDEVAREDARRMTAQVLIAEADAFVAQLKLPDGRSNGSYGPGRSRRHGVAPVEAQSCDPRR
jgi:hypothetical protein